MCHSLTSQSFTCVKRYTDGNMLAAITGWPAGAVIEHSSSVLHVDQNTEYTTSSDATKGQ